MPNPSTVTNPTTAPPVEKIVWRCEVEVTDYKDGKIPFLSVISDPDDEYLKKMQGRGWQGYARVYKNGTVIRSMHVSANEAVDLLLAAKAGQEPHV